MMLDVSTIDGTTVVMLPRRFDVDTASAVDSELKPVIAQKPARLLFDLSNTDYVSSAGMRVLLNVLHMVRHNGGTVALSSPGRQVQYVLEVTRFTKIFPVYSTRERALEELKAGH